MAAKILDNPDSNYCFLIDFIVKHYQATMDLSDIDNSLITCERELEKDPDNCEAWAAKADLLCLLGMYKSAVRCCEKSLALKPDNAFVWNIMGDSLEMLGRQEEAIECYAHARELEPSIYK